jgi:hypothetical protein
VDFLLSPKRDALAANHFLQMAMWRVVNEPADPQDPRAQLRNRPLAPDGKPHQRDHWCPTTQTPVWQTGTRSIRSSMAIMSSARGKVAAAAVSALGIEQQWVETFYRSLLTEQLR